MSHRYLSQSDAPILFQATLESFMDGILIVTTQKTCLHTHQLARQLCQRLCQQLSDRTLNEVPGQIWQLCQTLIDSHADFPNPTIILESEIPTEPITLRVRVRWLDDQNRPQGHLLVILEDINQSRQNQAIADADRYAFTPREKKV